MKIIDLTRKHMNNKTKIAVLLKLRELVEAEMKYEQPSSRNGLCDLIQVAVCNIEGAHNCLPIDLAIRAPRVHVFRDRRDEQLGFWWDRDDEGMKNRLEAIDKALRFFQIYDLPVVVRNQPEIQFGARPNEA